MQIALDAIRTDGNTQPRAALSEDAIRDYALDLLDGQAFPPIVVFHDGSNHWLAAGFHRVAAAMSIGMTHLDADVRQGGPREAFLFAVDDNRKNGVRYTNADKRAMVERFLSDEEWQRWNNSEIARRCGVDHKTVGSIRQNVSWEIPKIERLVTRNGTTYTMNVANIGQPHTDDDQASIAFADDDEPRDEGGFTDQQYFTAHHIEDLAAENNLEVEVRPADYSGDEWYTPAEYVAAAREVLGAIDLDPASCDEAQEIVQAADYYTEKQNGLEQPWSGRVWLNPPYSMPLIQKFVKRLIDHYEAGDVTAAIILTNNCTDAGWFHSLLESYPVCFTRGRIPFWRPNQTTFATRQGQAFFYLGDDLDRFIHVFSAFGVVVSRQEVPA